MKTSNEMKKVTLLLIFFAMLCFVDSNAQLSVGLRLGSPTGVTVKKHFSNNNNRAIEAYLGARNNYTNNYRYSYYSYNATVLGLAYLKYHDVEIENLDLGNLQWYFGFGGSIMHFYGRHRYYYDDIRRFAPSLQGYAGLSYQFDNFPFDLSLDIIPSLSLGGYNSGFSIGYGGLAIRYTLKPS
ncbi:hypothetical protein N9231_02450 [Saprospiraceae bacterium]|nr:hypothetical protein [Saprospiraceae bacterium]